ncbi:MAG TPA: hypothetical protein PLP05_07605, partial [Sedimentisphaerales bacterium]|nr:hypothetical protein [Sedimentisphaerales bacterium]
MLKRLLLLVVFSAISAISVNVLAVEKSTVPMPENGAAVLNEQTAIYLEWTPGDGAQSHDIYIGTNYNAVNNATTASIEFVRNRLGTTYAFEDFGNSIQYFWRIDEVTATTTVKGDVWTFTTLAPTNGLVGQWKMDRPDPVDNKLVKDYSGFGNNGTMGSADTWMAYGGIDFDGGYYGTSGIVFANNGANLIADLGLTSQITISYVAAWDGYFAGVNYSYDGRSIEQTLENNWGRLLSSECPTSNHILDHFGGAACWSWEAFNDKHANFIFQKNGVGKTWGDFIRITTTVNFDTGNYKIYVDDKLYNSESGKTGSFTDLAMFYIGRNYDTYACMHGKMRDFRIYNRELTEQEIKSFFVSASSPLPINNSDVVKLKHLSWSPGNNAVSHNVYFGTSFSDVKNADTSSPLFMGNQTVNTYNIGNLSEGMYFWRIDEINDAEVWKGDVWSFEILPPMPNPLLWLKMNAPDPENTRLVRDYSGNGNDGTMGSSDVWKNFPGLGAVVDFDGGSYGASGIVFANNGADLIADMGLTDKVTISFVMSGHVAGDNGYAFSGKNSGGYHVMSCEAPTGETQHFLTKLGNGGNLWCWEAFNSEHNNYIFKNAAARRISITADFTKGQVVYYLDKQVWATQYGATGSFSGLTTFTVGREDYHEYMCEMTDFRIYGEVLEPAYIAELVGDYPQLPKIISPKDESTENTLNTILQWQAGENAVSQSLYFGDNYSAVKNADASSLCFIGQQTATTYDPCGLEMMKTYYWRVDQLDVNGDLIVKGPVWQFSTVESIIVEDFESYDEEGNDIAAVWTDTMGYSAMRISLQTDPCLSPVNAMKLTHHVPDPYYAIADRSFSPAQDWTVKGVKILTINYYGNVGNFGLPAFVTIGDGTTDA